MKFEKQNGASCRCINYSGELFFLGKDYDSSNVCRLYEILKQLKKNEQMKKSCLKPCFRLPLLFLYVFIGTSKAQKPYKKIILFNTLIMDTVQGYKEFREQKKQILYSRMDDSMISRLREIRKKTGISVSEIIREAVRRLLQEVDSTGSINLKIN